MKGNSHALIGVGAGAIAGLQIESDFMTVSVCSTIGAISALVPDLDTNGLARNGITLSKQVAKWLMHAIGTLLFIAITYRFFQTGMTPDILLYGGIAMLLFVVSRFLKQKWMLTMTGLLVMLVGFVLHQSIGVMLAGSYMIIASFLPHRSYTHSLVGLAFFAFVLHHLHEQWPIDGLLAAGIAGYASHLIADMKLLPMNRRGVKWFAPLWNKEF